ncbi:MAG TPA: hypothetical protein VI958_09395, partial [Acidobacteriota bacterium]
RFCDPSQHRPFVQLGIQLLDDEKRLLQKDYFRQQLSASMPPRSKELMQFTVPITVAPGKHYLKLDLVLEGVTWFELKGSRPVIHPITILPTG